MAALRALDGKEIQKHLKPLPAKKIGIVKFLVARLVVDDAEIAAVRRVQCIDPIDKAGEHRLPIGRFNDHGRKLAVIRKRELLVARGKARHTQLVGYITHDAQHLLAVSPKEIVAPFVCLLRGRHKILRILIHVLRRDPENRFPRNRMEPALRHHIAHRTLEHMVRKRSEDGRVKACLPPRLEFQPIAQEKRIPAARKLVELRRGEPDLFAIEPLHRFSGNCGDRKTAPLFHLVFDLQRQWVQRPRFAFPDSLRCQRAPVRHKAAVAL